MVATWPTWNENTGTGPTQALTVDGPNYGDETAGDGTFTVTWGTTRNATLTLQHEPVYGSGYTVDWGDGTVVTGLAPGAVDGQTHTYSSNGSKTVTISGPLGYFGTKTFTVTNGAASSTSGTVAASPEPADLFLSQQWRDVETSGVGAAHPLSINRESPYVTDDPYTA